MTDSDEERAVLLNQLADEFAARHRAGQRPSLREYCEKHPDLSDDIQSLFPALVELEQAKEISGSDMERRAATAPSGPAITDLGDFHLIREIGRGGMGVVYEAEQHTLGRRVAIKLLPPGMISEPVKKQRFEREARAAAKLHHTNIVPIHGVGEHNGTPYYVMQFIMGLGLDAVIRELRRLDSRSVDSERSPSGARAELSVALARSFVEQTGLPSDDQVGPSGRASAHARPDATALDSTAILRSARSSSSTLTGSIISLPGQFGPSAVSSGARRATYWHSVARIGVQVARALAYSHKQGVLHRDIKPANLLLDLGGTVWVTDFGLAKADDSEDLTNTGDLLGTLRYMPPEAFEGKFDARSDVYALGLTLFELVALRPAFEERDRNKLIKDVTTGDPERLRNLRKDASRDLVTIIEKAIDRDPARRYQSAGALADDLQRFLDDEPIQARRQTTVEIVWRLARQHRTVSSMAAALLLLLVAITVGSVFAAAYFRDQEREQRRLVEAKAALAERNQRLAEENRLEKERADRKAHEAETNAAEAHAGLYVMRMNAIQLAWDNANLPLARELLELVRRRPEHKDLRGWEWHCFRRLCNQAAERIEPAAGFVECLAFSPDGQRIVTAGEQVKIWDTATRRELLALKKHGFIDGVAFSPDGTKIATAGDRVRVWDSSTGEELLVLEKSGAGKGVVFSPDGKWLASGCTDRTIRIWDAANGKELNGLVGHTNDIGGLACSPGGELLASASKDETVRLWDTTGAREVFTLRGHRSAVNAVAFRPDGLLLASCGDERDPSIKLWDTRTGQLLKTLTGHTRRILSVSFSPDGLFLVSGSSDDTTKVWDPVQGLELHTLKGHSSGTHTLAFSPDGLHLATGSSDQTVLLWDTVLGREPRILKEHTNQVRAVQFTSAGRLVSVGQDGKINVWDTITGQEQCLFPKWPVGFLGMAISSDGRHLATAGDFGEVSVWDLATGKNLWKSKGHPSWVSALAFSADGQWLASGGAGDQANKTEPILIKLWQTSTGNEVRSFQGHSAEIKGLAFTPDGSQLISGSDDTTLKVWDVATGANLKTLRGHKLGVTSIALDRAGNLLASASGDRTVKLWDLAKGQEVRTLYGHFDTVWSVAFHPDGNRLATAGWDQTVRVWDVATGLSLATLNGHANRVLGVAFSLDGNYLASAGGTDLTVRLWDARELTEESKTEYETVRLLDKLFAKPLTKNDVLETIRRDRTIDESKRVRALQLADRFKEETDPKKYYDAAWPIVRHPYANTFMCQFALNQLSLACQRVPDNAVYRIGLGVAQYRLGRFQNERYAEALATLTKCDQEQPATLAFLAMSQHQLGQKEQATTTLARLSQIMKEPRWAGTEEVEGFLHEAAILLAEEPVQPRP